MPSCARTGTLRAGAEIARGLEVGGESIEVNHYAELTLEEGVGVDSFFQIAASNGRGSPARLSQEFKGLAPRRGTFVYNSLILGTYKE